MCAVLEGEILNDSLNCEVRSLQNVPLDEGHAEGTHRSSHHEISRAVAAKLPWLFSSMRLKQNMIDVRCIPLEVEDNNLLQDAWVNWKVVLQFRPPPASLRPVKMKTSKFAQQVYRLGEFSMRDTSPLAEINSNPVLGDMIPEASEVNKLWEAYLPLVVPAQSFITLPSVSPPGFVIYQVISMGIRRKIVRSTGIQRFRFPIVYQVFECLRPPPPDQLRNSVLDVYSVPLLGGHYLVVVVVCLSDMHVVLRITVAMPATSPHTRRFVCSRTMGPLIHACVHSHLRCNRP
jgi:hypothetical protein